MDARELLAMVAVSAAQLERGPAGFERLTREDLLLCLAQADSGPADLLRVKYAGDYSYIRLQQLRVRFLIMLDDNWDQQKLPVPRNKIGKNWRHDMGALVLCEHIDVNVCWTCHGVGQKTATMGRVFGCPAGKGSGRKRPTDSQRARWLDIPKTTFCSTWSQPYRMLQSLAHQWETEACRYLPGSRG